VGEVRYSILGPLEATRGGEALALGGKAQRTVLAVLLLRANEAVPVDEIADAVWGDKQPQSAPHAVQVHVSNLRKLLGTDAIEHTPPGYVVHVAPDGLDLIRFEDLAGRARGELAAGHARIAAELLDDALALWRGPPLSEFAFDEFGQTTIAWLAELRLAALATRAEAGLHLGRHEVLVPELTALTAEHPYDERLHGLLMLALYGAGRQSDALAVYQSVRSRLKDNLGLDPSPSLRDTERRILTQDASLAVEQKRLRTVIVAPASLDQLEDLAALAEPLARARFPHELILTCLAETTQHVGVDATLEEATAAARDRQAVMSESGAAVRTAVFTTTDRAADLLHLAGRAEVDLLLLGAKDGDIADGRFGPTLRSILTGATCDVAFAPADVRASSAAEILVPFGAREHDWGALELGAWLASPDGRPLVLLGSSADGEERDASRTLADAGLLLQRLTGVDVEPRLIAPGRKGLIDAARDGGLLVMGLSDRWLDEGLGSMRWDISRVIEGGAVFVRRGLRPGGISPPSDVTHYRWSVTVATR
jgi:DNA-binding SARP family transcriptional activator